MSKRRRVSAEQVRKNAKDGYGGAKLLTLPEGVSEWWPDKPGTYFFNILPYEVQDDNHPDGIEKGSVWYKRSYRVHFKNGQAYICPKSVHRESTCFDCIEYLKQKKKGVDDEDLREFKGQVFEAFNIKHPDSKDGELQVALFSMSYGKFAKTLKAELEQADEADMLFFDVTKGKGRTLKVRFTEKKFGGKKFLEATKIDFKPRKSMDEEEVFRKVVNLDGMFRLLPTEKLKKIFLQSDEGEDDRKAGEKELKRKKSAARAKELAEKHPSPLKHKDGDDEEPDKDGGKTVEKKPKKGKKCPIKGGKFGRDCDKFKKCSTCPLYEACEAASG